jgi:hypothetical protein
VLHGLLRALVDGRDVLLGHATTGDGVLEQVGRDAAGLVGLGDRLDAQLDLGELAGAAGLLLVGVVQALDRAAQGLAVGDLRSKPQGRASYSMEFDSYAAVPKAVAEEIIKKTRGE